VLVVPECKGAILGRGLALAPALPGLLIVRAVSAVRIGAQRRTLRVIGFGDGLFTFFDLSGERRLGGRLRGLGSSLRGVNLGRALRCGQVG